MGHQLWIVVFCADHCRVPRQWFNLFSHFLLPPPPLLIPAHTSSSVTEVENKINSIGLDPSVVPVYSLLTLAVLTVAEIAVQLSVYIIPRTVLAKS